MKNIVCIGGGHGTSAVLEGVKTLDANITGIISMFDNGGSSGLLRDANYLPPGDLTRNMLALSSHSDSIKAVLDYRLNGSSKRKNKICELIKLATEELGFYHESNEVYQEKDISDILNYTFEEILPKKEDITPDGHTCRNLVFSAATNYSMFNYETAIRYVNTIMKVKGEILPVSLDDAHLVARLSDNTIIHGETNIDTRGKSKDNLPRIRDVWLTPYATAYEKSVEKIMQADRIILGPGDLYTSVIPALLPNGISEALQKTNAKIIYMVNAMTKHGETDEFSASDFVHEITKYSGITPNLVVANTPFYSSQILNTYKEEFSNPVEIDRNRLEFYGSKLIVADICMEKNGLIVHDPYSIADIIRRT